MLKATQKRDQLAVGLQRVVKNDALTMRWWRKQMEEHGCKGLCDRRKGKRCQRLTYR